MKHHHKVYFHTNSAWFFLPMMRFVFLFLILSLVPQVLDARPLSAFKTTESDAGPIIEFVEGEYILADGTETPAANWERNVNPNIYRMWDTGWKFGDYHNLTGRFHFHRDALGAAPIAFYTISTRSNYIISLNGTEVYRNFIKASDPNAPWYHPVLVPLPTNLLKPGRNEISVKAISQESLAIGRVLLGSRVTLQQYHQSKYFWQITGPKIANFAMLLLGMLAFLFWLGRKHEIELLWLTISTLLWYLRNYLYFTDTVPFNLELYNILPVYTAYYASAATAAFYLCFTKTPHRHKLIAIMFLTGVPLMIWQTLFSLSDLFFYVPTLFIVSSMAILGFLDLRRHFDIEHGVLGFTMITMPLSTIYDFSLAVLYGGDGSATYISLFGGLLYAVAFLISFGKRALDAFADLAASNTTLEQRVAETRAELAASETARQELLVTQAVADERERLMQEMHDGIGSNLTTALAVARQQHQPDSTIKTLNRALGDLKITVDSLEPVEGDLMALIGNLRHRMARDLSDAGISCKWEVEKCDTLPWLDAPNALNVLRIFQEAIGNVLAHSGASEMHIGCVESRHNNILGISTFVADNGRGFDSDSAAAGKGLSNMNARTKSLQGVLAIASEPGSGTEVRLWVPYDR